MICTECGNDDILIKNIAICKNCGFLMDDRSYSIERSDDQSLENIYPLNKIEETDVFYHTTIQEIKNILSKIFLGNCPKKVENKAKELFGNLHNNQKNEKLSVRQRFSKRKQNIINCVCESLDSKVSSEIYNYVYSLVY